MFGEDLAAGHAADHGCGSQEVAPEANDASRVWGGLTALRDMRIREVGRQVAPWVHGVGAWERYSVASRFGPGTLRAR